MVREPIEDLDETATERAQQRDADLNSQRDSRCIMKIG
jgi:hypothetical protein